MGYDNIKPKQLVAIRNLRAYGVNPEEHSDWPNFAVSFDPGRTTGWAKFRKDGYLEDFGQTTGGTAVMRNFLEALDPKPSFIICETFIVRGPGQKVTGDMTATMAIIKTIKAWCKAHDVAYCGSGPQNLPSASQWSGLEMEGDHSHSHWVSAVLHGWHWLTVQKLVQPRIKWPINIPEARAAESE